MAYVNSTGSDSVIASGNIHISGSKYVVRTETTKTTYYYYASGQVDLGTLVNFGYDKTVGKYYCSYYDGSTMSYVNIYNTTGAFKFKVKGGSEYKELVTVSTADGSHTSDTDFRTKLHCDLPRTDGEITYATNSTYNYYINNGNGDRLIYTSSSNTFMSFLTFAQSGATTYITETGSYTPGTSGSKHWSLGASSSVWSYGSYIHQIKNTNDGSYYRFSLSGSNITWVGNGNTSGGTISNRSTRKCHYHYEIEGNNLNNTDDLTFTSNEGSWTGLVSPTYSCDLDGWYCVLYPNSNFTVIQTNPSFTSSMGTAGGQWNVSPYSTLPTNIGNITCTNPALINDYEQDASEDRNHNTPGDENYDEDNVEKVRNGIFKICPKFTEDGTALLSKTTQTLTTNTWTAVNCTISNGQAIATDSNAYIYQDYYRGKYTSEQDENDLLANSDFRQRHFTHYRYMMSSFGIKDIGESTFTPYNPTIDLIYKPYGTQVEVSGHTWQAEYNSTIGYYDLLNCNKQDTSSTDEYMTNIEPETLALYDEGATRGTATYGITYLVEQPMTSYGYLPNVVGRIKIPIPLGKVVNIGELNSVYLPRYVTTSEAIDDTGEWESLTSLLEYGESEGVGFSTNKAKLYINSDTEPTTYTVNNYNATDDWQILTTVTSATFVIVDGEDTYQINKTFDSAVMLKFRKYSVSNSPYPNEYGIEWYYYVKDEDDEYEEIEGKWYRTRRHDIGYNIEVGSEFQEPKHYGLHSPKPTETSGVTEELWENRFLLFTINGARSFEIPEIEKWKRSGGETDTTGFRPINLSYVRTDTNSKGNRYIFYRDDLGEITFNLSTYTADEDGDYPIGAMFNGNGGLINWLVVYSNKKTDSQGNKYWSQNVKIRPRFDTLSGTELYRFLNSGNTTLKVKGDFGAVFSGINAKDTTGAITDESEYDNSKTLDFSLNTYYTSKLHGTKDNPITSISLTTALRTRTFDKVVDGCKYWWAVGSSGLGYIWRIGNTILRNASGVILQGKKHQ